ncbi:MAG: helix-turn-helix transcriptional regulator [Candidatus Bathyarchaeia archaeon]
MVFNNVVNGSHISEIKRKFVERIVADFLDIIIMAQFIDRSFSGYDVLVFIQKQFNLLLSPGTVYSKLYSMEREGLVKLVAKRGRKRIYRVTDLGKLTVEVTTSADEIKAFFARIFEQR